MSLHVKASLLKALAACARDAEPAPEDAAGALLVGAGGKPGEGPCVTTEPSLCVCVCPPFTRAPHALTRAPHALTRAPHALTRAPHALTSASPYATRLLHIQLQYKRSKNTAMVYALGFMV